jgi:hypothetical protein
MDAEPVVVVDDVDNGLAAELDASLYQFNVEATGMDDGRLLRIAVRSSDGVLTAGLSGWTWGFAATSRCSGSATTSGEAVSAVSSLTRPRKRCASGVAHR